MENKDITICLTSCGRFDLLERTIKSLVEHWDGPNPFAFYIREDSDLFIPTRIIKLVDSFCQNNEFYGGKNIGQIKSIDVLYELIETPYIFHCEDDWEFTRPGFIEKSLSILEENPKISNVWIRNPNDRNGHPASPKIFKTADGVKYQEMNIRYRRIWNGWSWNPGLRRLSDYKKVFPNGIASEITFDPLRPLDSEAKAGEAFLKHGYRAATLLEGYCVHIGGGRSVKP